jgi:cell division protein FtsW
MKLAVNTLVFCVAALLSLGMVMLYSSSMTQVGARYLLLQLVWCGLGLVACMVMTALDYRLLRKYALPLFVLAVLLLALVLVPQLGRKINGARRWFSMGGVSFQPSELAKLLLLVTVAWYCERFQRQMRSFKYGVMFPCLLMGAVLGLIFLEPDVGTTLLLAAVCGVMLLLAGIRLRYFLPPLLLGLLAVGVFIYFNPTRSERIYSWLHVEETRMDKGLQAYQSIVAIGSGGVAGKGLGSSRQKLGFVPEHHTDFIFSIIGEELGLIATGGVVAAFILFTLCGLYIARHAAEPFGFLLGTGLTFLIALQAFINIGVVTGTLPNKGLPLPFISYGGSNLLMMLAGVGILLSIARQARVTVSSRPVEAEDIALLPPTR